MMQNPDSNNLSKNLDKIIFPQKPFGLVRQQGNDEKLYFKTRRRNVRE